MNRSSSHNRILTILKKIDRTVETWVHHYINLIENEDQNQVNS